VTRPRLALLQRVAQDLVRARGRRRVPPQAQGPDARTSDELARRLDATRERLRQEIPPRDE